MRLVCQTKPQEFSRGPVNGRSASRVIYNSLENPFTFLPQVCQSVVNIVSTVI